MIDWAEDPAGDRGAPGGVSGAVAKEVAGGAGSFAKAGRMEANAATNATRASRRVPDVKTILDRFLCAASGKRLGGDCSEKSVDRQAVRLFEFAVALTLAGRFHGSKRRPLRGF